MKKYLSIVSLIFVITLGLSALDLGELGFDLQNEKIENGQKVYEGIDQYGNALTLIGAENLSPDIRKGLTIMLSILDGWKNLTIGSQRVVITKDGLEMVLLPKEFTYKGIEISQYMPAGMQFFYTTYLEYDFRLYKDRILLRVSGQVFDEDQFCKKLFQALENPLLYLQTHNPDYIFDQLSLFGEDFKTLQQNFALLLEDQNLLERRYNTIIEENQILRRAVIALSNGSLFKLMQPLDPDILQAILSAKQEFPGTSVKELVAILKTQGVIVNAKAVSIVLAVFLNEFE